MHFRLITFSFLYFASLVTPSFSQKDTARVNIEAALLGAISTTEEIFPHWLAFGRNGIFNGNSNEATLSAGASAAFPVGKNLKFEAGFTGIGKSALEESFLHEVYLNLKYGPVSLIAGKEVRTFSQYSTLGTGSYFLSENARPVPRIGLGFYNYIDLPLMQGYVQIKGFMNQGILTDPRHRSGTANPLLHEKSAYIRTNKLPINFHIGMNHSALFGGTLPNGTKIPVDFMATFFGKGSQKIGSVAAGEDINAAGAHQGLFDIGFNFTVDDKYQVQTYLQKPFSDKSGMTQFFERNKDYIGGVVIKNDHLQILREFIYESISTTWQSGPGLADPFINGKYYIRHTIDDYNAFMLEVYGIDTTITSEGLSRYIKRRENYGYDYGGRDLLYQNRFYQMGWSYHGKALGNSLFLTADRILAINPNFDAQYDYYFVNTRIRGHHFGIQGSLGKNIHYKFIFTFVKNFGTYSGLNKGIVSWDSKDPDSDYMYYFEDDGINEKHILLEANYAFPKMNGLSLNLSLGADYGEMYSSFGAIVGLKYAGGINLKEND